MEISDEALRTARHLSEMLKLKISSLITDHIRDYELTGAEGVKADAHRLEGISFPVPRVELSADMPLVPLMLGGKWRTSARLKLVPYVTPLQS